MRPDPPVSVRQRRMAEVAPNIQSQRQRTTIEMSDRMTRGFKKNATRIAAKQGLPYDRAAAILAATTRRASAAARRKNPRLSKVKGKGDNK
jgi:hypothetical protein